MSDTLHGPGWWQASDGEFYPPQSPPGLPSDGVAADAPGYPTTNGDLVSDNVSTATIPDLWPLKSPKFYRFASDDKRDFSWDETGFRIVQFGGMRDRTLHSFPLTEEGWAQTWQAMVSDYPKLADAVAKRTAGVMAGSELTAELPIQPAVPATPTPSNVWVLGTMLGWGPWSAGVGLWLTFGNSGDTIGGQPASTSAVHGVCQAGAAILQPGICGSADLHWTLGVSCIVIGIAAFLGGIIGLFVAQQRNPRAWKHAGGPIFMGLILGVLAVLGAVVMAIARAVKEGQTPVATGQSESATGQLPPSSAPVPQSYPQVAQLHWRVSPEGGWIWLAADGNWYPQAVAPPAAAPPAPPPPTSASPVL